MAKRFPSIGCCGIDCGLCPRFYTDCRSRCPGCGGDGFEDVHPPCSFKTCCADKNHLETCSQCAEFPYRKYKDKVKIEHDSFVTHKRIFQNHEMIKGIGFDEFIKLQDERILLVREMLENYYDGRSKSFYCLAAALLSAENLRAAIMEAAYCGSDAKHRAAALKSALKKYADIQKVELKLIK